ncbi:hypothetical protein PG990_002518 [Apiospora arundinis]
MLEIIARLIITHQVRAKPQVVAVKRFRDDLARYFHRERLVLETVSRMEPHPHLVKAIAAFERGKDRCVLFPWADGGNLSDFWQESDAVLRNAESRALLVSWSLEQMAGIADGLHALHAAGGRHGDLKPENLLHFKDGDARGRLTVADFGLAKFHVLDTYRRDGASSNWSTTLKYEPPEVDTHQDKPRSRHYDMWSLGCIFLEFAIWIVHGWDYLKEFKRPLSLEKFWEGVGMNAVVHHRALEEMDIILNHSRANSATKDIVKLVRDRLLVVKFSEALTFAEEKRDGNVRATSAELCDSMKEIQERANNNTTYLSGHRIAPRTGMGDSLTVLNNGHGRRDSGVNLPQEEEDGAPVGLKVIVRTPTGDLERDSVTRKPSSHPQTYRKEQTFDLNDRWISSIDNTFAMALFQRTEWSPLAPPMEVNTARCAECSAIDFLSPTSTIPFDQQKLREKSDDCDICAVILEALSAMDWTEELGTIVRKGTEFRLTPTEDGGEDPLVLSLYAGLRAPTPETEDLLQLGYPQLPPMRSQQQYEILRAWRDACDNSHHDCYPWKKTAELPAMPTRVIDVGTASAPVLRLVETSSDSRRLRAKYVALSHCWGQLTDDEKFCATKETMDSIRDHIPFEKLPQSFRDAVTVTRELGVRYLWIDSICIIQDDKEDWAAEAQKMGDVFNSAYCTLAASSAKSSTEGFMGPEPGEKEAKTSPRTRLSRKVATVATAPDGSPRLYLCRNIDNFRDDVEGSVLASRGWVFQERALSRRTIHFTSTQLYWECGKGVHCETLGKLNNTKAALMGDAEFPQSALKYFKGGRISLYQYAYEVYSRLAFTHWTDRAVALLGLESRIGAAFKTRAEFGILEEYLRRGLLWKRSKTCQRLSPIEPKHGSSAVVPSWSWMAYEGAIDYLDPDWGKTDWCEENLESPFAGNKSLRRAGAGGKATQIQATAFGLGAVDAVRWSFGVTMDEGDDESHGDKTLKCVVVGQRREDARSGDTARLGGAGLSSGDKLSYVLFVKPVPGKASNHYRRVGVGNLLASEIQQKEKLKIIIV